MRSLNSRVLIAAGLVLAAFLGSAGFALDQAFRDSALTVVRERLTARVYFSLGLLDIDTSNHVSSKPAPPESALANPESGQYVQLLDSRGERVWHSRSMLGMSFTAPHNKGVGEFSFSQATSSTNEALFILSYTVLWEGVGANANANSYTVQVAENERAYIAQIKRFRKSLWLGFLSIGVILLLVQTIIFRWGLKPLRDVAAEVSRIEKGEKKEIAGDYPLELKRLTENLNALISTSESSVKRYRNALGDLAHSLKTPLAVLRSTLEKESVPTATRSQLGESLDQLDATIDYQLQRAAAAGRSALGGLFDIAPVVTQIENSLRKVHAIRGIEISSDVESGLKFRGDRGDLMEMLGNIADNACKWARTRVDISVTLRASGADKRVNRLNIVVTDDGSGMPAADISKALLRGSRLDQTTAGHGIGLAVVKELVEDIYNGKLEITTSGEGTKVSMSFPDYE